MSLTPDDRNYFDGKFGSVHNRIDAVSKEVQLARGEDMVQDVKIQKIEVELAQHVNADGKGIYPSPNLQRHVNDFHSAKAIANILIKLAAVIVALGTIGGAFLYFSN